MNKIVFENREDEFWKVLRNRVNDYFQENKLSKFTNAAMNFKMVVMVALFVLPLLTLLFFHLNALVLFTMYFIMGIGMAGIGFCISHQAAHNAIFASKKLNRLFSLSFNLVGMSDYIWKIKHNVFHHTYTNVFENDEALKEGDLMRLSQDAPYKPMYKYQHIYGFFIYMLFTVFWAWFLDVEKLFRYNGNGSMKRKKHPFAEVVLFWSTKIYYFSIMFIVPVYFANYSIGQVVLGYFIMNAVASLLITHVLQVEHLSVETIHVSPQNGIVNKSWAQNQLEGTCNFKMKNRLFNWYIGATNYQIEHHLFPQICSIHYPAISPIVEQTAKEFGYKYIRHESFSKALVSHYRFLKELGQSPKPVLVS